MRINMGVTGAVRSNSSRNKKQEDFYVTKSKDKKIIHRSLKNIYKP